MIDEGEGDASTDAVIESNGVKLLVDPDQRALPARAPKSTSSTTSRAAASRSRTRTPSRPAAAARRSASSRFQFRAQAARAVHGSRYGTRPPISTACAPPAASVEQARPHRQRLPAPGGAPHRRRPLRPRSGREGLSGSAAPPSTARCSGWSRRASRARSISARGASVRALVPAPAPLSSHLQDLQPLVRVPQLRHRGADRGSGGGAQLHGAAERAADPRHLRGVPDRPAGGRRGRRDRAPLRPRCAADCDRHRAQRPRVLLARGAHDEGRAGPSRLREAGRGGEGTPRRRSRRATASCCSRTRSSNRGRRSCSSRARPICPWIADANSILSDGQAVGVGERQGLAQAQHAHHRPSVAGGGDDEGRAAAGGLGSDWFSSKAPMSGSVPSAAAGPRRAGRSPGRRRVGPPRAGLSAHRAARWSASARHGRRDRPRRYRQQAGRHILQVARTLPPTSLPKML